MLPFGEIDLGELEGYVLLVKSGRYTLGAGGHGISVKGEDHRDEDWGEMLCVRSGSG